MSFQNILLSLLSSSPSHWWILLLRWYHLGWVSNFPIDFDLLNWQLLFGIVDTKFPCMSLMQCLSLLNLMGYLLPCLSNDLVKFITLILIHLFQSLHIRTLLPCMEVMLLHNHWGGHSSWWSACPIQLWCIRDLLSLLGYWSGLRFGCVIYIEWVMRIYMGLTFMIYLVVYLKLVGSLLALRFIPESSGCCVLSE